MGIKVYKVNAFTKDSKGGNCAGVVLDGEKINELEMQIIAKKLNFSETAFVIPKDKRKRKNNKEVYDYEVKFFTPTEEVDLCGHATIATFFTLAKMGLLPQNNISLKQKTKAGILDVDVISKDEIEVVMSQAEPEFSDESLNKETLSKILNLCEDEIGFENLKPQIVSTGLRDILIPIKNEEDLKNIKIDNDLLINYSRELKVVGIHAFAVDSNNNERFIVRNFAPAVGIPEESATGTSNGALLAYLIKNNFYELKDHEEKTIICRQGMYMGNASEIIAKGSISNGKISIKVGGKSYIEGEEEIELKPLEI
ncbi:PhzF family phenazine biosynthesis protein [Clostridium senegalense]|uniref:PhzF family phenazine biosynthesis protein n=1 Tax=Clostridium senegalense TaxID=1465809 RepID=UPI001C112483|nr:PhzF family phenazine biosynthesis protein [Clostridium senegalense]MBU5226540.1 PhzF family phenazine biosynthesis protein [Clostridium senegalense]